MWVKRRAGKSRGREVLVKSRTIPPVDPSEQQIIRVHARGRRHTLEMQSLEIGQFRANQRRIAFTNTVLLRQPLQLRNQYRALQSRDPVIRSQRVMKEKSFAQPPPC